MHFLFNSNASVTLIMGGNGHAHLGTSLPPKSSWDMDDTSSDDGGQEQTLERPRSRSRSRSPRQSRSLLLLYSLEAGIPSVDACACVRLSWDAQE
jgi:hypothetical protein